MVGGVGVVDAPREDERQHVVGGGARVRRVREELGDRHLVLEERRAPVLVHDPVLAEHHRERAVAAGVARVVHHAPARRVDEQRLHVAVGVAVGGGDDADADQVGVEILVEDSAVAELAHRLVDRRLRRPRRQRHVERPPAGAARQLHRPALDADGGAAALGEAVPRQRRRLLPKDVEEDRVQPFGERRRRRVAARVDGRLQRRVDEQDERAAGAVGERQLRRVEERRARHRLLVEECAGERVERAEAVAAAVVARDDEDVRAARLAAVAHHKVGVEGRERGAGDGGRDEVAPQDLGRARVHAKSFDAPVRATST